MKIKSQFFHTSIKFDIKSGVKKDQLFYDTCLLLAPMYGFNELCIFQASQETGIELKPSKLELLVYYHDTMRMRMRDEVSRIDLFKGMKEKERLLLCLETRLKMTEPFIEHWPAAIRVLLKPKHIHTNTRLLYELINDIWYLVGDKSLNYTWYQKRAWLTAVYISTELAMTVDNTSWKSFMMQRMNKN